MADADEGDGADDGGVRLSRRLRQRGAVVLSLFAVLWALVAASGLPPGWAGALRVAALVVAAVLVALARRPAAERARALPDGWWRGAGRVNGAQFAVIAVVVVAGVLARLPQLVAPVVAVVVGLHFWPLARLFDQPEYRATAVGGCAAGVAGLALLAGDAPLEAVRAVTGGTTALVLWGTAVRLVAPGRRDRAAAAEPAG